MLTASHRPLPSNADGADQPSPRRATRKRDDAAVDLAVCVGLGAALLAVLELTKAWHRRRQLVTTRGAQVTQQVDR